MPLRLALLYSQPYRACGIDAHLAPRVICPEEMTVKQTLPSLLITVQRH